MPKSSPAVRTRCWPDANELTLLQAGLWEPSQALNKWNQFCNQNTDLGALENGLYRLFPLVAFNLKDQPDVAHYGRLKSVLRHWWANSQKLVADAMPALRRLEHAKIDFMVLKGMALAPLQYKRWGLRPMADVDILIHAHEVSRAKDVMIEAGWNPPETLDAAKVQDQIQFRHEILFKNEKGVEIDVHWHLSSECRHPETENLFWRDAVPCPLPGLMTKALEPADQFLHTCLHGVQWNEVSAVRWLVDATFIVRHGLDWDRLERHAQNLQRVEPVRETLLFLDEFGIAIPPEVVERWQEMKVGRLEATEGGYRAHAPSSRHRTRNLALAYVRLKLGQSRKSFWRDAVAYQRQIHHFKAYSRRLFFLVYLIRYRHLCEIKADPLR